MPRLSQAQIRKSIESSEQTVGQDRPRDMPSTGPARIEPPLIEPVLTPFNKEKDEAMQFMEEFVTIRVHDSTNPTDEPFPEVWNDGVVQRFQRGIEQKVKRKYVEVLARAKKTTYTQERYKDGNGNDAIRNIPHTALRYPFAIIGDTPKGNAWLKSVLEEA